MPISSQKSTGKVLIPTGFYCDKLEFPAMQAGDQKAPVPKSQKAGKGVMLRG
jgi:hypothetical protein